MSNKAYFAKEIKQRSKELDRPEDALCIGLTSLSSYSSSARSSMLTQHLVQALVPNHPEIPAVCTSYEQMFGHFSTGYLKTDSKLKVVKKIVKHEGYVYTLVVYDSKKDEYDIINRKEVRNMAESYGYRYNNECIDSYKEGDVIKKDTMLYRSPCIDEHENFMYGVNLNTMYTVSQETIEDSVVISESAAKKLATTKVDTCEIPFNDNDIFLNLYGDNETFKAFPDIGEKIKKSILCATRRKNKVLDQLNLKNSNLKKIFPNDDIFQLAGNYRVVDIDIWSNKTIDDIPGIPAYDQLRKYFGNITNYYQEIYDTFMEIKENGSKYSKELSTLYAKARDFLDPGCRYVDEDKMFSNMVIEFTLMKKENIKRGCKICGRYGNKSVISKVLPDNEMGTTDDGRQVELISDALGILGRLNSGQCIEQELNWLAGYVLNEIKNEKKLEKQISLLLKFLKSVNKEEYTELVQYLDRCTDDEKKEFIQSVIDDKIYMIQSPLNCVSGDDLFKLYDEIQPQKTYIHHVDENGREYKTLRQVIVAPEYILRLKQEPISKISVRSKSLINPRTFLPIKSTKASKHKIIYPDQCNRIGEQELNILMLSNDSDALDYFYRSHSASVTGRRSTVLFEDDPDDGFIIDMDSENSRVVEMFNAYMKTMGLKLDIQCDNPEDNESVNIEYDIPKIPDYIKKLF